MKALTICQPYPHLICTPQSDLKDGDVRKRVENRTWGTSHRGPLLIHAGRSKAWLRECGEGYDHATDGKAVNHGISKDCDVLLGCVIKSNGKVTQSRDDRQTSSKRVLAARMAKQPGSPTWNPELSPNPVNRRCPVSAGRRRNPKPGVCRSFRDCVFVSNFK